jgi:hypothetical protein
MAIGRKKKTPSRVKYEQKRPTFSFRTYKELDERVQVVKKAEGISNTDIVEIAVGLLEVKVAKEKEAKRQGYEEAKKLYMVPYLCCECGKPIAITSPETKRVVSKFLTQHGWGHAKCIERTPGL